jgi:carboxyl-terminal processing protease
MTRYVSRHTLTALVFTLFGVLLGAQLHTTHSPPDAVEQFQKMKRAFLLISGKYVEQVSAERLATGGVAGMLDRLDPHSSYVPPEGVARKRNRIRGSFGGVGIRYNVIDDTARIVSPIEGGPSEEAGLLTGDRIVKIEDSTAVGLSTERIQARLTGREGTTVTFTVYRPISNERINFTVQRGEVSLRSVRSSYLLDDQTGYLKISRFAQSTPDEFVRAVNNLKRKGLRRLVIDLRGNTGGVLKSATRVADELLGEAGLPLVRVEGRASGTNRTLRTQTGGILDEAPVTLLVDGNTASASEILAGALQDHDRALLVGRRTFGKGLVQKPFSLPDGSLLNLTVAAYYTPVGRFIQTPYEDGQQTAYYQKKIANRRDALYHVREYRERIPDSLTYRTMHGRTVFGGGGILPDYVVPPDTTSLSGFLKRRELDRLFRLFAADWLSTQAPQLRSTWQGRPDGFLSSYRVPNRALSAFWRYAQKKEVLTLTPDPAAVNPARQIFSTSAQANARSVVRTHVKGQLANVLFGNNTGQPLLNRVDPTMQDALSLWSASQTLADYHTAVPQKN